MTRITIVLACLVAALAAAAPAHALSVLSVEQARVHADAYGDRIAWSSFDPDRRVYRLVTREGDRVVATKARPSTHPLRLDVGPGPDGKAVAVYPRCRRALACDLYLYDFEAARERRLGGEISRKDASESLPTVWRTRVAFSRRVGSSSTMYIARLDGRGTPALVPGGRVSGPSGPIAIELRGARLIFVWSRQDDNGLTVTELFQFHRKRLRWLDRTDSTERFETTFVTPEIRGRRVFYGRPAFGRGGRNQLRRADVRTRRVHYVRAPWTGVVTAVWLREAFLMSRVVPAVTDDPEAECRRPGTAPEASVCRLVVGDPVRGWKRLRVR